MRTHGSATRGYGVRRVMVTVHVRREAAHRQYRSNSECGRCGVVKQDSGLIVHDHERLDDGGPGLPSSSPPTAHKATVSFGSNPTQDVFISRLRNSAYTVQCTRYVASSASSSPSLPPPPFADPTPAPPSSKRRPPELGIDSARKKKKRRKGEGSRTPRRKARKHREGGVKRRATQAASREPASFAEPEASTEELQQTFDESVRSEGNVAAAVASLKRLAEALDSGIVMGASRPPRNADVKSADVGLFTIFYHTLCPPHLQRNNAFMWNFYIGLRGQWTRS
ncbi:hypothetical protein B0H12DRAFT_1281687 [Mycena haematopus]|nr:hypothetical protein B0H12DRAFT_1281687 [Mycena haematopus]